MWDPFAARMRRMRNHFHAPAEMLFDPTLASAGVALIHPQMFDARELLASTLEQQRHPGAVLDIGSVHFGSQHEAAAIDQDVAFAAINALGPIVATDAADPSRSSLVAAMPPSTQLATPRTRAGRARRLPSDSTMINTICQRSAAAPSASAKVAVTSASHASAICRGPEAEAVNPFETGRRGNYCAGGTSAGLLIQAGTGKCGGRGTWRTKRSGWAA
jgi:hypothetical protein